jgi:hypothetical protein
MDEDSMQLNDNIVRLPLRNARLGASGLQSIEAVLNDENLDTQQKRAILSSWASDLWTVESCPWLRNVPGIKQPLRVSDIFAALRALDDRSPPPSGGGGIAAFPPRGAARDIHMLRQGTACASI